jgi:hypothetical protein
MPPDVGERSFDALARGLANGDMSRSRALRLMGAALVGSTLASLGIDKAGAAPPGCKRDGKACKKNTQCCSGNCSGGTCAPATGCREIGLTCTSGSECCSAFCSNSGTCCRGTGGDCTVDSDCCGGFCSIPSGGGSGICATCRSDTSACTVDTECCSGICDGGICRGCRLNDSPCTSGVECCTGSCVNGMCSAFCIGGKEGLGSYIGSPALLFILIHPSAWKGRFANFVLTAFPEKFAPSLGLVAS